MGRIQTPQINFSLIDTNYTQKELALKIRVKFGIIGHLTLLEVLLWINAGKGCYAEYSESTPATFAMTRLGSLEHAEEVKAIFMYMLEIGFFDLDAFREDKILTSEGIVRRWMAAKRRPEIYDFPAAVKGIIARIKKEETPDGNGAESGPETDGSGPDYGPAPRNAGNGPVSGNNANIPQTAPLSAQTAHLCTENAHLSRQGDERNILTNKKTNKQNARKTRRKTPEASETRQQNRRPAPKRGRRRVRPNQHPWPKRSELPGPTRAGAKYAPGSPGSSTNPDSPPT